jgi:hypothetical protein
MHRAASRWSRSVVIVVTASETSSTPTSTMAVIDQIQIR